MGLSDQLLMAEDHEQQDDDQIDGKQCNIEETDQETEEGRHEGISDIGGSHLDTDDRLGRAARKAGRRGVYPG